jgi:small-conductance mechanosensitive channel
MNTLIITALLSSAFAATTRSEVRESNAELSSDYSDIRDDSADLHSLESIITSWDRAYRHGAYGAERSADAAMESWLRREIAESQREIGEARSEVRDSKHELRREAKEARNAYGRHASQERAEARDDARDLKDDRRDLDVMEADLRSMQRIAGQLSAMQQKFDRRRASARDYQAKRSLLEQLRSLSKREIRRDHAELKEDLAERSEARWD